mmetsp:Transcript_13848/g.30185  ORF Transcript_13848/g.30185 Transcript_13848/m.30185 type:complete len:201 (-) Transcript_13848:89-691(-)
MRWRVPSCGFHKVAVESIDAVAKRAPEAEKTIAVRASTCPISAFFKLPVLASQRRPCQSREAVATMVSSGESQAAFTTSPWPANVWRQAPVCAHQTAAVMSSSAPTINLPLREKFPNSIFACSGRSRQYSMPPVSTVQTSPIPSGRTVNKSSPHGEKAADRTFPSCCATTMCFASPLCGCQMQTEPCRGRDSCSRGDRTR